MSAARFRKARVSRKDCVSCGACAKVCPKGAIAVWHGLYAVVDEQRCIGCGRCANECPAGIISMAETER